MNELVYLSINILILSIDATYLYSTFQLEKLMIKDRKKLVTVQNYVEKIQMEFMLSFLKFLLQS